ncbi:MULTISPECIES: hypothetical protein [unclassified Undibacterium]|uniref:hypothetical protein n=1 Tax=unclassified Undibacterium TaxID=2630295 RepID=UPI002AC8D53F|nr:MULTISPECIES: hypothetical protein [unclassified Undibacterium]MEB0140926.1 hypothetical protein [Undibacterium sp. CCC2.1]MEB0173157.1 hypothetical protein [Undibacterium sp. CCC1.1]MEB0177879.1 hypothetical protein [Undibacterium sp. CCC3.4]MEB0216136.1 hypothetical protein [Undibacterium sp. 5I2]WPX42815.1 hypothetical protein RHM61_15705 [Undibacterium sp. CCC3.4]
MKATFSEYSYSVLALETATLWFQRIGIFIGKNDLLPAYQLAAAYRLPADCRQRLGLISIYERLDILGAQLSVASQLGHGTTATLTIPLATASQTGAAA